MKREEKKIVEALNIAEKQKQNKKKYKRSSSPFLLLVSSKRVELILYPLS